MCDKYSVRDEYLSLLVLSLMRSLQILVRFVITCSEHLTKEMFHHDAFFWSDADVCDSIVHSLARTMTTTYACGIQFLGVSIGVVKQNLSETLDLNIGLIVHVTIVDLKTV